MEPLAHKIRNHTSISGLSIEGKEHKITLFADDIILTLIDPDSSLPYVYNILKDFNKISYYKINATFSV